MFPYAFKGWFPWLPMESLDKMRPTKKKGKSHGNTKHLLSIDPHDEGNRLRLWQIRNTTLQTSKLVKRAPKVATHPLPGIAALAVGSGGLALIGLFDI